MKTAYFDCFSGISGDMVLGALLDLGLDMDVLLKEIEKLGIRGYEIKKEKVLISGISATRVIIEVGDDRARRTYKDISGMIYESGLSREAKGSIIGIFKDLAEVEGRIHGKDMNEIHFHEIGAVDSIIDISGTIIGLEKLGIGKILSSNIHVGTGFVECEHGTLPIPAPATISLLKGIPVYSTGIKGELVTPTGAVLIKHISRSFGKMPLMNVENIGYGAGTNYYGIPNILRIITGESL